MEFNLRAFLEENSNESENPEIHLSDGHWHIEYSSHTIDREYVSKLSRQLEGHFYEKQNLEGNNLVYGVSVRAKEEN